MSAWEAARSRTRLRRRTTRRQAVTPRPGRGAAVRGGLAGVGEQVRAARALLDRPLTSYYLIAGITTLLLCLGLVMVLSTASVADLSAGRVALPRLRGAARRHRGRRPDHVGRGPLPAAAVPGGGVPAARGGGHRAVPDR